MPVVTLNRSEVILLTGLPLNSVENEEVQLVFYRLNLLLDEHSGVVEIPGEMWDQLREFALSRDDPRISNLILKIFSRTLGKNLDLGFFGEE